MKFNGPSKSYFREVSRFPLLTREEEVDLAQKVEAGDMEARAKLVNSNLRLVISIAKNYRNNGLPFLDLIQAGNVGLIKAVDKYDWRKGYKFSTYAYWWIKQTMLKTLSWERRTVRIPDQLTHLQRRIRKEERKEDLPPDVLADRLEESVVRIKRAKRMDSSEVSLDGPVDEEGGYSLIDLLEGERLSDPETDTLKDLRSARLKEVMADKLTEREKRIIELRYGLVDHPRTLAEVGEVIDLSKERVRQLQKRALEKLRKVQEEFRLHGTAV